MSDQQPKIPTSPSRSPKHTNTPKQIILKAQLCKKPENPEKANPQIVNPSSESMNNFLAIKKLRQTEQHIKMIKGRFKVLKLKQQSFRAKTIYQENIIKFNEEAEKFKSQHKAEIIRAYRERQQEKNQNKEKNLKLREQIRQKNKQVREEMLQEKIEQNKKIKQQSIQNDKKYKQIKIEDKESKAEKRKKIVEEEKQQKHKIDRYKQIRVSQTKQHKTVDMNSIIQKNHAKQKQLEQLMKMQEQMQKQHGKSVQASRLLKVRLQSVINRRKDANSHHSRLSGSTNLASTLETKLPEINNRSSITIEQNETVSEK